MISEFIEAVVWQLQRWPFMYGMLAAILVFCIVMAIREGRR